MEKKLYRNVQRLYINVLSLNKIVLPTVTVTIAFQDSLLNEIDKTARKEFRSRSELIREAARLNIEHRRQWSDLFMLGDMISQEKHLTEDDVSGEIKSARASKVKSM